MVSLIAPPGLRRQRRRELGDRALTCAVFGGLAGWLVAGGWRSAGAVPVVIGAAAVILHFFEVLNDRPRSFTVTYEATGPRFVAPPDHLPRALNAIALLAMLAVTARYTLQREISTMLGLGLLCVGAPLTAFGVVEVFRRRNPIELRRDGLRVGRTEVPWEAIKPSAESDVIQLDRPELVRGRRRKKQRSKMGLPGAAIDPAYLVWAINYYAAHPEHRAAIGTHGEQARLQAMHG